MGAAPSSNTARTPNVQPNNLKPSVTVEVFLDGESQGEVVVPQDDLLSKSGNIIFSGIIKRGLRLPEDCLSRLSFAIDGEMIAISKRGVCLSSPRKDKDGHDVAGTGNEPMVSHWGIVDVGNYEAEEFGFTVTVKRLHDVKAVDQGHSLRVQGIAKLVPRARGPQVIGQVSGLTVATV
jgi:hypothetical protein